MTIGTTAADADFVAWQTAADTAATSSGGLLTVKERLAARQWFADMKAANLWSKITFAIGFLGSTLAIQLVPFKGTAPTNTGFVAADATSAGLKFGTGKRLDTAYTPAQAGMSVGNGHIGVYSTTAANGTWVGAATTGLTSLQMSFGNQISAISNDTCTTAQSPNNKGHFLANATGGNLNCYRFGFGVATQDTATSGALGTSTIAIGALNTAGTYSAEPANGVCAGVHFGAALTKLECFKMGQIWLAFQQAIGSTRAAYTDVGTPIAVWGDSEVTGANRLAAALQALLPNTQILDRGVSGQTAAQIAARFEAGDDTIDCINLLLLGKNDFNNNVGNNNTSTAVQNAVLNGFARCVARQALVAPGNGKYLVMMPMNARGTAADANTGGNYPNYTSVETTLSSAYGASNYSDGISRFRNTRAYLVAGFDSGTSQDVTDHGLDVPPSTLMVDLIHWNSTGATREATALVALIAANGW